MLGEGMHEEAGRQLDMSTLLPLLLLPDPRPMMMVEEVEGHQRNDMVENLVQNSLHVRTLAR